MINMVADYLESPPADVINCIKNFKFSIGLQARAHRRGSQREPNQIRERLTTYINATGSDFKGIRTADFLSVG